MLEEDGAFCRFAPGHFLTFFEYAKNFQEIKKIQEVNSKMVIIERATDLWNPTLGTLSITKFQIKVQSFEILKIRISLPSFADLYHTFSRETDPVSNFQNFEKFSKFQIRIEVHLSWRT